MYWNLVDYKTETYSYCHKYRDKFTLVNDISKDKFGHYERVFWSKQLRILEIV